MKKITYALFVLALLVVACSKNEKPSAEVKEPKKPEPKAENQPQVIEPELINGHTVGMAEIGMTIQTLREKYPDYTFVPKPVYEYGVDGEANGLLALKEDEPQFFVWTLDGENTVHGIVILSGNFVTENGLKVGITIEEVLEKYPEMEIQRDGIDPNMEFINIEDKKITLHFINPEGQYIGEYDTENPDETSRSFDLDRKVDRIYVN
jgi:hypothetical protein